MQDPDGVRFNRVAERARGTPASDKRAVSKQEQQVGVRAGSRGFVQKKDLGSVSDDTSKRREMLSPRSLPASGPAAESRGDLSYSPLSTTCTPITNSVHNINWVVCKYLKMKIK